MVSGGIKVTVKNGKILKEDLPPKINPFIRIKAGNRIADSRKLALNSIKDEITWNQALSLVFKDETQLYIQLLDSDKRIPNFHDQIGVCVLNMEMLQINQNQEVFGIFYNNNKLAALIELEILYETTVVQKVQAATVVEKILRKAETEHFSDHEEAVYESLNLKLKVIDAKITHDTEAVGEMKPYARIKWQGKEFKTDILKGKNPKWNQLFMLEGVKDDQIIEISVWDKETMKQDDLVGRTMVQLRDYIHQEAKVQEFRLKYTQGKAELDGGSIRIEMSVL